MFVIAAAVVPNNPLLIVNVVPDIDSTSTTSFWLFPKINKSPTSNQSPSSTTNDVEVVDETVPSIKTSEPLA